MRTIALGSLLFLGACGGRAEVAPAPMTPCETTAAPAPAPAARADKPRPPEVDQLAAKRIEALRAWLEVLRYQAEHAALSRVQYLAAKRELAVAARDSGLRGEALRSALEEYVAAAKESAQLLQHGRIFTGDESKRAEYAIAEAEFWLAEAKARE